MSVVLDSLVLELMKREDVVELIDENYEYIDPFIDEALSEALNTIASGSSDEDDEYFDDTYDKDTEPGSFSSEDIYNDEDEETDEALANEYIRQLVGDANRNLNDIPYDEYIDDDEDDYDFYDDVEEGTIFYESSGAEDIDLAEIMDGDLPIADDDYLLDPEIDEYIGAVDDIETLRGMEAEDLIIGSPMEDAESEVVCTLYPCGVDRNFDRFTDLEVY